MSSSAYMDESHALEMCRRCVAGRLPSEAHPEDDEDLVRTGALDSMGWVDVLISVESATGLRDFGGDWPENRPKSIRELAEAYARRIQDVRNNALRSGWRQVRRTGRRSPSKAGATRWDR